MYILGISAYYHDSAAVLLRDGMVIAAIEEERFTRIKHDNVFPFRAIEWCLKQKSLSIRDIDVISYYEKPLLKFERILDTFIQTWPHGIIPFVKAFPEQLGDKITIEDTIIKKLHYKGKISFVPHHVSHASAAYNSSPFTQCAILTIDGVGEYQTTGLWKGSNGSITLLNSIQFPHSIGLLYSTFAAFLGFKVNEDEYKLMGLAAYGKPNHISKIKKIIDIKQDGSFKLNMDYFAFREEFQMWSNKFEMVFGRPRSQKDKITQRHADIAISIQKVTEEICLKILTHLYTLTKSQNLCISGGVALNALVNGQIHSSTPFKNVHILGVSGDSGAALGAALYAHYNNRGNSPSLKKRQPIKLLTFGSEYSDSEIETILKKKNVSYKKLSTSEMIKKAAMALHEGYVIGWFQGKCELGPRALGNRSILAKPSPHSMKTRINTIKIREEFRPFAGSILQEHVEEYFEVPEKNFYAPFMNFCFKIKKDKRKKLAAIVHADKTCRIQTVSRDNGMYYQLIKEFFRLSGIPCVLNTSFNLKGEPIVETPEQAISDFLNTKMDYLFIGSFLVKRYI
jgi:carbamoyltransferase